MVEIVSDEDAMEWQKAMSYVLRQAPEALGNFAKGTGAGLAGLPVDMVSEILRFGGKGIPVGDKPVMGSRWLREKMGVPEDSIAATIGEFASPDPLDAARLAQYGPDIQHMLEAMTVFHGSPHKWDKVDLSKVGTGEGAQAFGHGFYAAERKGIGEEYRDNLTPKARAKDGYIDSLPLNDAEKMTVYKAMRMPAFERKAMLEPLKKKLGGEYENLLQKSEGFLYELDLPDSTIDKMLDWDKPLSEQPESVRKVLNNNKFIDDLFNSPNRREAGIAVSERANWEDYDSFTAKEMYESLVEEFGSQSKASQFLNELGIPGIKYLDGTSRNAGEGTRNFVIFNENDIKPLKRNGEDIKEE